MVSWLAEHGFLEVAFGVQSSWRISLFLFPFMCRDNLVGCDLMVFIFWEYLGFEVYWNDGYDCSVYVVGFYDAAGNGGRRREDEWMYSKLLYIRICQ